MPCLIAETLTIDGPDAIDFAHRQLSSDVRALAPGTWQWSAWLNPQGRVRALLQVMRPAEHRLQLLLRGGTAAAMAAALKPYVMRSQLTLTAQTPAMLADASPCKAGSMHDERDGTILGHGSYAMRVMAAPDATHADPASSWRLAAIHAGHPWLPDATLESVLAPSLSLQQLGAASLDKGCFPGQEVLARLHYRGGCKQHLRHIRSDANLTPGSPVLIDDRTVGTILDSVTAHDRSTHALAVLRDTVPQDPVLASVDDVAHNITTITMF